MNGFSWIFLRFFCGCTPSILPPLHTVACFGCVSLWCEQIGQLLSAFGLCTMFAEGVLVRWMVPRLGEKLTLQIGACVYCLLGVDGRARAGGARASHSGCVPNWESFVAISNTWLVM